MRRLNTLQNREREARIFQQRMIVAVAGMVLLTATIVVRLVDLQMLRNEHYSTLSRENRLKLLPLPPTRGIIYSRDGTVLATNRPSFALEVVPERVADLDAMLAKLGELVVLDADHLERFEQAMKRARPFEAVLLKSDLDEDEVARFAVNQHRFDGFALAARLTRHYPEGETLAHLLGYVGRINEEELKTIDVANYRGTSHIGKSGVEAAREGILHGTTGWQRVEVNAFGRVLRVVEKRPPLAGKDLYLTVDVGLQRLAMEMLEDRRGAIVAIEPFTGAVLAFASAPAYDPNDFVNGIGSSKYKALRDAPGRPLFNRALQGQYPPGSTVKPMVALGGIVYGLREANDRSWCPGWYSLPGRSHQYRDWLKGGHGHVDLVRSLAESCDVYYYELAHDLGIERLHAILAEFGFGRRTGIDLPGETGGLLPSPDWKRRTRDLPWYPGETLIAGIGQGFMLASPLQLAYATAIIANRGLRVSPHVVGQIEDPVARTAEEVGVLQRESFLVPDSAAWDAVTAGMDEVVNGPRGTARRAGAGSVRRFAGKTGTAQLFGIAQGETIDNEETPQHLKDHALFIAFAPLDEPQIALGIVVENGGSGSRAAAPIARTLIDYYFGEDEDVGEGASGPPSDDLAAR